jgi:hypothetical protein
MARQRVVADEMKHQRIQQALNLQKEGVLQAAPSDGEQPGHPTSPTTREPPAKAPLHQKSPMMKEATLHRGQARKSVHSCLACQRKSAAHCATCRIQLNVLTHSGMRERSAQVKV